MNKLFTGKKGFGPLLRHASKFVRSPQRRQVEPATDGVMRLNHFVRPERLRPCPCRSGQHEQERPRDHASTLARWTHWMGPSALTPSPHSEQMNASMTPNPGNVFSALATWAPGTTNLAACKFHQRGTSAFQGNRIDHRATLVTDDISQITAFLNDEAAFAIRSSGDFVGDDHVAAFIFGHSTGSSVLLGRRA